MRQSFGLFLFSAAAMAGCGGGGGVGTPTPVSSAPSPTATPTPAPTPTPVALRVADLRGLNDHFTRGTARLFLSERRLTLGEDFATNGSRTIDIFLTRGAQTPGSSDAFAGMLMSRTGVHTFELPDADVSGYTHVLVWCRPFRIAIGEGELVPAP